MRPSVARRLRHPVMAINQGLPTSRKKLPMRAGEAVPVVSEQMRRDMKEYLVAVPLRHENQVTMAQEGHLYGALSIIDSKAQALLSFNSFLLAIVGIYFGTIQSIRDQPLILIPFLMTVIASGVSCLLCLDVVWIHWLTTTDMTADPSQEADVIGEGFIELLLLRDERTRLYRLAWLLSFGSVAAVIAGVLFAIFIDFVPW